jgi:phosphoribosylamine--glycine ligase
MRVLLVGSGGREHALALKLRGGETPVELFAAPGSDAIGELGTCLPYGVEDLDGLTAWCAEARPDLVVIGPEAPMVLGLADRVRALSIPVFGHDAATAALEGSKALAKAFMFRHGIPCAASVTVSDWAAGEAAILGWTYGYPLVLKADGLAAGKGVVLAQDQAEALATLRSFLDGQFGEASKVVVLEAPLFGMELSQHVLVDVTADHARYVVLPPCQDHKRIFEGDRGPNTGGMGAFGPMPFLRPEDHARLRSELIEPTVNGLQKDGLVGRGVFFLGVMWDAEGPKLLEYNTRFGDPETQVLMQLLDEDLPTLLLDVATASLTRDAVKVKDHCALTVVLAAEDYPEGAKKGVPIELGEVDVTIIHAGTKKQGDRYLTHGGRVLNLATSAPTLEEARAKVAKALGAVSWPGMQVRRDIGLRALNHAQAGKTVQDAW